MDSKPCPDHPHQIAALRALLSEPRFKTYLNKGGNDERYALALYLYNVRVAQAFMFPLGVVEVTLRNAIDARFADVYGENWHRTPHLHHSVLTRESLEALEKAINRVGINADRGRVVAELTFDFWSNLLRPDYGQFWRTNLNIVFPNIQRGRTRHEIQKIVREINEFRNRVAHHEPILDRNVTDIHAKIVDIVSLRCRETAAWLKHHSTVSTAIRTRPHGPVAGFVSLGDRLAPDFVEVLGTTRLDIVASRFDRAHQAAVRVGSTGAPTAAFGPLDLVRYVSFDLQQNGGFTLLSERTVDDLLTAMDITGSWVAMDAGVPLADAIDVLKQPGTDMIVGVDPRGKAAGVLIRAHRRY
ncbi:Abi family protein [Rhodospirillum centenum]|uniref:Abi-like protein n=1 Tax=Rhodospirillum centenum (strain ATCC 51521 / SW) TaxID=414684 RepID=B6IVX5_RHOCS|nr:Abi family protein [Rhodospirillum centenum]ACJ00449.1 conserved hypothetical protein [Rhodospirillum centenum SW]